MGPIKERTANSGRNTIGIGNGSSMAGYDCPVTEPLPPTKQELMDENAFLKEKIEALQARVHELEGLSVQSNKAPVCCVS